MKLNFNLSGYDQIIEVEEGAIGKWHCLCPDFSFRQIHKNPIGQCKHIKEVISKLDKDFIQNMDTFSCEKHGIWRKEIYPHGCPVCIADEINNSPEVIAKRYGR